MLIWNETPKPGPGLPLYALPRAVEEDPEGFFATTRIATPHGWRQASSLTVGDPVLTHDTGLQPIAAIRHMELGAELSAEDPSDWPLFVPAGSVGNTSDVIVMPGQYLLIESRLAERLLGTAHVMIRAADMDSARGVFRVAPSDQASVMRFVFRDEQVIMGAGGALFACQGQEGLLAARARGIYQNYPRLTPSEADLILSQDIMPAAREGSPPLA